MPLSLEEQFFAAETVTAFARLLALDRIRTDYLQKAERPIPEQDVRTLSDLTDEMDGLLEEAQYRGRDLNNVIHEHGEELHESYMRMLSSDELTEDQKGRLQDATLPYRMNIVEYGSISVLEVVAGAPAERETLATEMRDIRRGGFAASDLSPQYLCNLAAGCIVGGLLAPPPTNIMVVVIGILTIVHVEAIVGEEC
jgi:hypothetical protein